MNQTNQLCLFVKSPRPGQVKTRMQPELSPGRAAAMYRAMVEDLLERVGGRKEYRLTIYYQPPRGEEEITDWLGRNHPLRPQTGQDLGERMAAALDSSLAVTGRKAIVIGSDIPDLDHRLVTRAFEALDRSDVVLGPSRDGGYYLIGLTRPAPELFKDIHWGGDRVYSDTLRLIRERRLSYEVLPELPDLDTFGDLKAYQDQLDRPGASANPRLAEFCRAHLGE